jgi:DNA topoisomerase-1
MSKINWKKVNDEYRARFYDLARLSKLRDALPRRDRLEDLECPFCEFPVVQRRSQYGPFLACTGYPYCTATCSLSRNGKRIAGEWRRGKQTLRQPHIGAGLSWNPLS